MIPKPTLNQRLHHWVGCTFIGSLSEIEQRAGVKLRHDFYYPRGSLFLEKEDDKGALNRVIENDLRRDMSKRAAPFLSIATLAVVAFIYVGLPALNSKLKEIEAQRVVAAAQRKARVQYAMAQGKISEAIKAQGPYDYSCVKTVTQQTLIPCERSLIAIQEKLLRAIEIIVSADKADSGWKSYIENTELHLNAQRLNKDEFLSETRNYFQDNLPSLTPDNRSIVTGLLQKNREISLQQDYAKLSVQAGNYIATSKYRSLNKEEADSYNQIREQLKKLTEIIEEYNKEE